LRARAVTVRLLVCARLDRHDMSDHGVTGEMNSQATEADTPFGVRVQTDGVDVRNKIYCFVLQLARLELAAKKVALTGKPVGKLVARIEDKVGRPEDVKDQRRVVDRDKPHRLRGRAVEVLIPGVERRRKEASRLPLDGNRPVSTAAPELSRSAPLEDKNLRLIEVADRTEALPRWNLPYQRPDKSLGSLEVTVGCGSSETLPVSRGSARKSSTP